MTKVNKKTFKQMGFVAALVAIPICHFIVFYLFINGSSILLAFKDANDKFTFDNFRLLFDMFSNGNSTLARGLINTLKFFLLGLIMFPISLVFSYFLYKKIWLYKYFRVVYFLPSIISGTVMVTLFKNIVNYPVARLWAQIFRMENEPLFFDSTQYALKSIMVFCVWTGLAGNMIIFGGTMARIPTEVLESGKIDGVGFWREFAYLVVPLIWPTLSTLILMSFIGIFSAGGPILLFTQGQWNTYTISYWIYDYTVVRGDYNLAATAGLFFTLIGLPIIFGVRFLMNKLDANIEY